MNDEKGKAFQGLWFGNYKKKLAGVVVSEESLPYTLMIEDDNSYAVKGEERNFVYGVYGGSANSFVSHPELSQSSGQDFHLPFYFCGMLKRIVEYAEKANVSLADAAVQVQYTDFGYVFPVGGVRLPCSRSGTIPVPGPPQRNFSIFVEGVRELRKYNPDLIFWANETVDEKFWAWPDPQRPKPKPVEKPKVKTDMTMREANYWLGVLRQTLCGIVQDNIKGVTLRSDGYKMCADASESHWVKLRERDFGGDEYFDVKSVTRLELRGYLPIREKTDGSHDGGSYYFDRHTRGEIRFESCMQVIRNFMRDCFGLNPNVHKIEISCEHWSIPVRSMI